MPTEAEQATIDAAAAFLAGGETPEGEGGDAAETQGAEEAESQETAPLLPTWEVELPDDLAAELETPEVTDEDIQRELEQNESWDEMSDSERALLARATAAEKKAKHFEDLRVADARKSWVEEAKKFFPLSAHALPEIKATSRTAFLRQAKDAHTAVIPYVKEITDKAAEAIDAEKAKATAEARAEAEKNWGKPPTSNTQPGAATVDQDKIQRHRERRELHQVVREMIFPTKEA